MIARLPTTWIAVLRLLLALALLLPMPTASSAASAAQGAASAPSDRPTTADALAAACQALRASPVMFIENARQLERVLKV